MDIGVEHKKVFRDRIFDNIQTTSKQKVPRWSSLAAIGDEPGLEGNVILDRSTGFLCYHNGLTWTCLGPPGSTVDLFNGCPSGVSLVVDGSGPDLTIAGLLAGTGISIGTGPCVTISSFVNLLNGCLSGVSLVVDGSGPDMTIAGLLAGTGISIGTGPCVTISSFVNLLNGCPSGVSLVVDGSGPDMTIAGLLAGTGITIGTGPCVTISSFVNLVDNCPNLGNISKSIVLDGSGPDLLVRGLTSGTGIMLLNDSSCIIVCATGATEAIMLQDACDTGVSLIVDGSGPIFELKSLIGGTAIQLSDDGSCVTIGSTGDNITLGNACPSGVSLLVDGSGPDLLIAGLLAGTGVDITTDGSCVTISADASALNTNITLSNACPLGISLLVDGSGPDLSIAGLLAGTGVDITTDGSCVTISADASALNSNITLSNACPLGISLLVDGSGPDLSIAGLLAGTGVDITTDGSCVTISADASALNTNVTLSNVGSTGTSLVGDGSGPDLTIKQLKEGTGIDLIDDGTCVTIAINEAATTIRCELTQSGTNFSNTLTTVDVVRIGRHVIMRISPPASDPVLNTFAAVFLRLEGTSDTVVLPSEFRPFVTVQNPMFLQNFALQRIGIIFISSGGTISFNDTDGQLTDVGFTYESTTTSWLTS